LRSPGNQRAPDAQRDSQGFRPLREEDQSSPETIIVRVVALIGSSGVAAWQRWPLGLAGLGVMLLGPLICWSLYFGRVLPRLGILPSEYHPWLMIAGVFAVWAGWVLVGAHLRPLGSRLGGAIGGGVVYLVVGWAFFFGLAMYYGHSPVDMLAQPPTLFGLRAYVVWPLFAAGMVGLISLGD
jgi:hypothetical protein